MTRLQASTIDDVARLAGVSVSTVSNVLNGREARMRAETLERVQQAIATLGFRPNQSARRLKTGQLPMIGLLVPSIDNPFYGALARWVEQAANGKGFGVLLCNTDRSAERERDYSQAFMAQGIQGVILGSALQAQEHLAPLIRGGLAAVSFDRTAQQGDLPMDYVSVDNHRAGALAAEHLIGLGHQRLVFVAPPLTSANRQARLDGARQACANKRIKLAVHMGQLTPSAAGMDMAELGRSAAQALAAQPDRATGVMAMNDMLAIGLVAGLRQAGLRLPQDVSVVGIDDLYLGQYISPALSTVRQPMQDMASAAVDLLLARMANLGLTPTEKLFAPHMVERESSARFPDPSLN